MSIAFIDESVRESTATGFYLIAVVSVGETDLDKVRNVARSVLLSKRQVRFHWHDESVTQRLKMMEVVRSLSLSMHVYCCRPLPAKQDRARARCIERMLWDFREVDIARAVFESRRDVNNRKDSRTIGHGKRAGLANPAFDWGFQLPSEEPILWLADALAGAVASHLAGEDSRYLKVLPESLVRVIEIAP